MVAPPGLEPGSRGDPIVELWKLDVSRTPHDGPLHHGASMLREAWTFNYLFGGITNHQLQ